MIHLIFEDLTFNEKFQTYFQDENFTPKNKKEYNTLAIIGCQSSGKSTLLNHIFNTQFEVMSDDKGRGQTTQGIWAAINKEFSTIVFDVEGTDAKERGDDRFKFEQCSSLFALAMADVLLINMWTNDIGRYTASNYGVLKIVFEQNLKLFQQESEKKIVIVLRDFNEFQDDKDRLMDSILGDIKKIWGEIKKPDKFKDAAPEQFFKFDFYTLPHKFYEPQKFIDAIEVIKKDLRKPENEYEKYLFDHVKYDNNVPIDGFAKYTWDMWGIIINNKDVNIPGQKEMLAQFRCNEIKNESLNLVENKINELELESSMKNIDNFKDKIRDIENICRGNYEQNAKDYLPHVFQNVRKDLLNDLANKLYSSFANQLKRLIPKFQKDFRIELENNIYKKDNFYDISELCKKKYLEKFEDELKKIKYFESWDVGEANADLFDEIIENQRTASLEKKKEEIITKLKNLIEDSILTRLETLNKDFWFEMNSDIILYFQTVSNSYRKFFNINYNMENEEYKNCIKDVEKELIHEIKKEFLKKSKEIPSIQIDNFKSEFWNKDGIPRVWNQLSESEIDKLYNDFYDKNLACFDLFKQYKVIPDPLSLFNYEENENENEIRKISNEKIPEKLNDPEIKYENLLNDTELKGLKIKYEEGTTDIYEDAKRRHNNIRQTVIPIWAWILLIYVSYQDIWKMVTGYWLIPMIIIAALYGILNMLGLGKAPLMIINMIKNQIMNMFNK